MTFHEQKGSACQKKNGSAVEERGEVSIVRYYECLRYIVGCCVCN